MNHKPSSPREAPLGTAVGTHFVEGLVGGLLDVCDPTTTSGSKNSSERLVRSFILLVALPHSHSLAS